MKVTLLAVVTLTAVASLVGAADPECVYRKLRGLSPHWPNPTSCSSYYRCSKNTVRSITCPAGKLYNAKTGKCSTAKRGLCKLSLAAPLADVTNICAEEVSGACVADSQLCGSYYICNEKMAYPQDCDSGSYFNTTEAICMPDTKVQCWQNKCLKEGDGISVDSSTSCADYYVCHSKVATLQTCDSGSYFNSDLGVCVVDENYSHCWVNFCIGQVDGKTLRDDDDCGNFYICSDEKAALRQCPAGNYFDPSKNDCIPGTCPDNETTTVEPPSECDCEDNVRHGQMVPNKDNCRKYYTCVNGVLECGDCQQGNYFNPNLGVCEKDKTNCCSDSSTPDCKDGDTAVKPEDCNQYYICVNGAWQEKTCLVGTYFDTAFGTCNIDEDNVCPQCNDPTTHIESQQTAAVAECKDSDRARSVQNCWSYLACISGHWKMESCVAGYYFDDAIGICRRDDLNLCPENGPKVKALRSRRSATEQPAVCANRPNSYQTINPEDCTSYITCSEGLPTVNNCPSGEWYTDGNCVIDVTGICINPCSCGTGNATHPICSEYYQCTDGVPQVESCPSGQAFDSSTNSCSSSVTCNANKCATAQDGESYPVEGDSSRFYVCIDNVATIRSCPANTAFDITFHICMAQPSCSCDQSKCNKACINTVYPSLNDNTTFCVCQSDGAYLESCDTGYYFDTEYNVCDYTGLCDPSVCIGEPEYSRSPSIDTNSFCLCRAGEPVSVPCPTGYTYNVEADLCVLIQHPDPRCCSSYCEGKADDSTFEALDTNTGFCLCENEIPNYYDCPPDKIYDTTFGICIEDFTCVENGCNATMCEENPEFTVFPKDTCSNGFCYCKDFCPIYKECPAETQFDAEFKLCLDIPLCDDAVCDTQPQFLPFESLNGTDGFCYCQSGQSIYKPCLDGKQFSVKDGVCMNVLDDNSVQYCCQDSCLTLPEDANYASTNDCDPTSFCQCQAGAGIYENCPLGKVYDSSLGVCMVQEAPASICLPGVCSAATTKPDHAYEALNTTTGFCLCIESLPVYKTCPVGTEFESTLGICLTATLASSLSVGCDRSQCARNGLLKSFAARDRPNGYCECRPDGTAMFQTCANDHRYIESLSSCVDDVCDPIQCRIRARFEAFPAKNTNKGFCACDTIPTYSECSPGTFFNNDHGLCLEPNALVVAACNYQNCKDHIQYEPFAASNTTRGFCACDRSDNVRFHQCRGEEVFNPQLGLCEAVVIEVTESAIEAMERVIAAKKRDIAAKKRDIATKERDIATKERDIATKERDIGTTEHILETEPHGIEKRSVSSEEKFACQSNDKRSVPANCSQYEICLEGNWRRRACSEERYYNPEQQVCLEPRDDMVCNYARVSGLPPCNNVSESATIPNPNEQGSCLQYFRCAAGKWRLRSCPKLHYYVPQLSTCLPMPKFEVEQLCSWTNRSGSSSGKCQHLSVRPYATSCDRFLMCMENSWWIQQCPLGMYFNRSLNYCLPNDKGQCREEQNATVYSSCVNGQMRDLASSCRGYELCYEGQWLKQTCLKTEQFEPLSGCVPNDGNCLGSGLRRACNQGELRALHLPDTNCSQFFYYCEADDWHLVSCLRGHSFIRELGNCQPLESCQSALKTQSLGSCKGLPDGKGVPHAEDCTRFYLCLQQQPALLQSCAGGSFFDALLGYCRPNDGSCQPAQPICGNSSSVGLVAHAQNCRAFYNCSGNDSQLLYCPEGQYFDSVLKNCRLDTGQCSQRQILSDPQVSLNLCAGQRHGVQLPHKLFCNLFYACVRGLAFLAECEHNRHFNAIAGRCANTSELELQQCQLGRLGDMTGNRSAVYGCQHLQDGSYVPDYTDCTRYYICSGGVALAQRCAAGAYFDGEQLLCLQDEGSCPHVLITRNEIALASSDHLPPSPLVCEGKHGHILPDTANCNNFYVCISNKLRGERCYAGHFFNSTLQQCQSSKPAAEESKDAQLELKLNATALEQTLYDKQLLEQCNDAPTSFEQLCEVIGDSTSIAEPGDCRRYISCEKEEPISQRCRNGESYDSLLGICRQNDGTCLMENGERVGVCNGRHGQLAHDEHNCREYFVCVHGQKINAECEQGYYFSKALNICQLDVLQQCSSNSNELAKPISDE